MKTATVADLRNRFPRVFKWIEDGEQVELTRRGRVVARLVPASPAVPRKFKIPDFAGIEHEVFGANPPVFTPEDSAFIRDRGER
jgi:prevent-host-death family protein